METINSSHNHLRDLARCHRASFPSSLSSMLGLNYCMQMLSFYLEDERGLLFHIEEGGKILGYCGGLKNRERGRHGSITSMTQYTFRPLLINMFIRPWLVFHHEIRANIPLIIRNIRLRFSGRAAKKSAPPRTQNQEFIPSMGLVVIGVSPEHQGKGYGSILLKEFESRARQEGFHKIHLSVRKDNNQAIAAYRKNGWEITKEGKEEISMSKALD